MKRWIKLAVLLLVFGAVWTASLLGFVPLSPYAKDVVAASPLWTIIAFASYSVFVIGFNLFTFSDSPVSALKEVEAGVTLARAELAKRGFKFD